MSDRISPDSPFLSLFSPRRAVWQQSFPLFSVLRDVWRARAPSATPPALSNDSVIVSVTTTESSLNRSRWYVIGRSSVTSLTQPGAGAPSSREQTCRLCPRTIRKINRCKNNAPKKFHYSILCLKKLFNTSKNILDQTFCFECI